MGVPADVTDVFNRYFECDQKFGLSNIVKITGDSPLIDIDINSNIIATFLDASYDYLVTTYAVYYSVERRK